MHNLRASGICCSIGGFIFVGSALCTPTFSLCLALRGWRLTAQRLTLKGWRILNMPSFDPLMTFFCECAEYDVYFCACADECGWFFQHRFPAIVHLK